jgi:uncharacterized iron-regulated membrane protein
MKFRRFLFWSHFAAGLCAGGVIFFMAVSGMAISFQPQIVEWAERGVRSVPFPLAGNAPAARLSLDSLLSRGGETAPKGRAAAVTVKSDPAASVSVSYGKEGGNVHLDPYTGAALGRDSRVHAVLKTIEELHRWLGSREIGRPITGAACLFFSFLLFSGLYLWFPRRWTRAAFRSAATPAFNLKGKAKDWNRHTTLGFWAAPLLLITTLTGTVISYRWASDLVFVATGNAPPPRPPEEGSPRAGGKVRESGTGPGERGSAPGGTGNSAYRLDAMLATAEGHAPGWTSVTFRLPKKSGGPVTAMIEEPGSANRYARSQLTMKASTAEVIAWEPYSGQNLGRRIRSWIVPIHTGRAGGMPGQILAALSAATAAILVWTGFALAWRRISNAGNPARKSKLGKDRATDPGIPGQCVLEPASKSV